MGAHLRRRGDEVDCWVRVVPEVCSHGMVLGSVLVMMVDVGGGWAAEQQSGDDWSFTVDIGIRRHPTVTDRIQGVPAVQRAGRTISIDLPMTDASGTQTATGVSTFIRLPRRPQDPQAPYPYEIEEVRFANPDAGITLAGTITRPGGEGPFPAVVLISGSGQQNRDEEIFGHRPVHVFADALTRAGIAVLRYDDRGVGGSEGAETLATMTTLDSASDATAALAFLEARPYVDAERAGLLGHSEGALIAVMIAAGGSSDFIVLLAGNGVPGDELLMMQSRALLQASGANSEQVETIVVANRRIYDLVLSGAPREEVGAEIDAILADVGVPANQIEPQRNQILSPWIEFFRRLCATSSAAWT